MKVDVIAMTLALCFVSGAAYAQESMTMSSHETGSVGARLIRPCTALTATSDCSLGIPRNRFGSTDPLSGRTNNLMNNGSGISSTSRSSAGPLGANAPTDRLSRGISGGSMGSSMEAVGPLGVTEESLERNVLGGGSLGGGSLGGRSLGGGSLSGGSSRLR